MSSTFSDIFDELHFIQTLRGDVQIVKELPQELEALPRARKHFVSWSGVSYYEELTQLWKDYQVNTFVSELLDHGSKKHFLQPSCFFNKLITVLYLQISSNLMV